MYPWTKETKRSRFFTIDECIGPLRDMINRTTNLLEMFGGRENESL